MPSGNDPKSDLGPLISPASKERVCSLIESGKQQGAEVLLDGRDVIVPGYEKGNFVGTLTVRVVVVVVASGHSCEVIFGRSNVCWFRKICIPPMLVEGRRNCLSLHYCT